MMNFKEFQNYIKDNIKEYLPGSYGNADISFNEQIKNNDIHLTGITIRRENEMTAPNIYLNDFFEAYQRGKDLDEIVGDVADKRIEMEIPFSGKDLMGKLSDYEKAKKNLEIKLCDKEENIEKLKQQVYTEHGLYERFNINRPKDFTGHSMSVGDIIVVNDGEKLSAYFVDSVSFKELDQFIDLPVTESEKESEIEQWDAQHWKEAYKPLAKVEELEEQNYNMVDNILNNGFDEKNRRKEIKKAAEEYQQKTGATITFFAAVCEEFPSMGDYFDGLTIEQAVDKYKKILGDPRLSYMGNGMGVELHDSTLPDYLDGPLTLIKGRTIYADNIDSISAYREHPILLEVLEQLKDHFPEYLYIPTAQEKQEIYPENMNAKEIGYALTELFDKFDTYQYNEPVEDKQALAKKIEYDLYAGLGKKVYAGSLKDIIDENDNMGIRAQILLQRINEYSVPEKIDIEPVAKLVFSDDQKESGEYQPFKEVNEMIGTIDQKMTEKNQEKGKWEEVFYLGYVVLCSIDSKLYQVHGERALGVGEGNLIEHMKNMKSIKIQKDVQEIILPYLYEYCGLVEKSPEIITEAKENEVSLADPKAVRSELVTVKELDKSAGEKKKSIHDRLKENKEKLDQKSGKDDQQKGVELM